MQRMAEAYALLLTFGLKSKMLKSERATDAGFERRQETIGFVIDREKYEIQFRWKERRDGEKP